MKILQLTNRVPFPPTDGGAIGIYNITKGLAENGCEIDLLSINTPKHSQPTDAMKGIVRNQYDVFVDTNISVVKLIYNLLFKKIPYNVERFISKDVCLKIKWLLTENNYDFVQVESAFVAFYIDEIRKYTNVPIIVRTHNIEYVIWERLAINEKNIIKKLFFKQLAKRLKIFERNYYNKADGIAAITYEDQERLKELGVSTFSMVIPAGVVFRENDKNIQAKQNTIFSISALDWMPNIEGLKWFLDKVWFRLLEKNPNIELHIAGKSTPEWLKNANYPNTQIHGFVDDALIFKQSYQLMLVPLLSGGGMRVKIIEGMAAQKCIISTTIGAEGINYQDKHNIVIADTPEEWINNILFYIENHVERERIALNAKELAQREYENKNVSKKYLELFHQIKLN